LCSVAAIGLLALALVVSGVGSAPSIHSDDQASAASARTMFDRARKGSARPVHTAPVAPAAEPLPGTVTFTRFVALLKAGQVAAVILPKRAEREQILAFESRTGQYATTTLPDAELLPAVVTLLIEHETELLTNAAPIIDVEQTTRIAAQVLPFVLLLAVLWFVVVRGPGGSGTPGEWILPRRNSTRFADVCGIDEARAELVESIGHLLRPMEAGDIGAKPPRGVLLVGQPGTGKTMLARAVAGEAGASFLRLSGSDFVEMWVGLGARRVRNVFKAARKRAPCVIFIDEIDSLGRKRSGGSGAERESDQTLNALLVELDGFARDDRVLVLAATNRVDTLDEALVRPGRFDRHIHVGLPDMAGRLAILEAHARNVKLDAAAELGLVARGTPGFSGADLANLINEAAFAANRRGAKAIGPIDLEAARDRVMMGSERQSMVWREEERVLTAWHEAGHALIALVTPDSDPVHKATIRPRGGALGMVMRLPEHDRFAVSRAKLEADLAVAVAGRLAEELKFGRERISTGAEADIQAATDLAQAMVTRWGMSERLGFVRWAASGPGEALPEAVRQEIKAQIDTAMERTRALMTRHRLALDLIAQSLLDKETLNGAELQRLVDQADRQTAVETAMLPAPALAAGD
jgi:cell division protease FtsH